MTLVGNVHLIAGDASSTQALLHMLRREGIATSKNPDLYLREYSSFGIDEARSLCSRASMRAFGMKRIFIVVASAMTTEAQNALLKTIEEAPGNALFFFIVPAPHMLLLTIRSRAQILDLGRSTQKGLVDMQVFLKADAVQRLEMLKPMLEKGNDDKRDVGVIITFLSSLERSMEHVRPNDRAGLESIYRARKYIGDKGALVKPLLEQVALLV